MDSISKPKKKKTKYSRQACVVGRSSLHPKDVPRFLDSTTEDTLVSSTLGSTNVILSLNKKKRWRLPATVSHMIKTGDFNEGKTMVSLLERHKLKRRANCVSFVCNQGRLRHVTPKQKRYFSFNLENIDNDQSKRQRKRQIAEAMKKVKPPVAKIAKDKKNGYIKTIEVFTIDGSGKTEDGSNSLYSSKPEYRLEVFYPCPQSCSLAYNPKYTKVNVEFNEEGNMEMKFNSKSSKSKRRHRKRFTSNDLEIYENEMASFETLEIWDEEFECGPVSDNESDATYKERDKDFKTNKILVGNEKAENGFNENHSLASESILASLVVQAERARSLCHSGKLRRCKKNSEKCFKDRRFLSGNEDEKSHIVYTNEIHPWLHSRKHRTSTAKTSITTTNYVNLHTAKVILRSTETAPDKLKAIFGHYYAEADSEPRRFIINVTEDVQNLLCTYKNVEENAMYTSFLVFVFDGVYDEGLNTFTVLFNSNICTETRNVIKSVPFEQTSIEEIMNRVVCVLLDMKQENLLSTNYAPSCDKTIKHSLKFVNDLLRVNLLTIRTSDEITRVSQTDALQENADFSVSLLNIVRNLDFEIFCDICYENINPTQAGAAFGTKLSKCSHIFCDECWRSHFRAKFKGGAVKMGCPGFDCDVTVGPVTLLSLLHVSEVIQLFQRKCEEEAQSDPSFKWCPNSECGRIIRLESQKAACNASLDVTCACGHEFCFSCLSEPHWPATCEQAENYLDKLHTRKPLKESTDDSKSKDDSFVSSPPVARKNAEIFEVEGRVCPQCSKFIEKDGGCAHMSCKCGHEFCWMCLKAWRTHKICFPNAAVIFEHTRKVKIRHLTIPTLFTLDTKGNDKPKSDGSRQKATMYDKALQQRLEAKDCKNQKQIKKMVTKIAHISQRDHLLKRQILSLCGVVIDDSDESRLASSPLATHVTKLLRSCHEIKRGLHHVAEFTFVLLQDTPDSVDKRRALRLANDLSGYCSFIRSILDSGPDQNVRNVVKRLVDIQIWAKRALTVLLFTVDKLKNEHFAS